MNVFERIFNAIKTIVRGPLTKQEVDRALTEAASRRAEKLDPLHSIVDLLKVLDLPSDLAARQELARDEGFEGEFTGTADQNMKLHQATMERIAKRCIEAPKE